MTALDAAVHLPAAFLRRDRRIETSYRAGLLLRVGGVVVSVGVFYFLSRSFGAAAEPYLVRYGSGYFAFVLLGIALMEFLSRSVSGLGAALREGQTTGTLELMLLSPSRLPVILLSSVLWLQVSAAVGAAVFLATGAALGADFSRADVPASLLALAVAILGFTGLGLLAGAVVLLVKRGNPLGWAIRGASVVLGGVLYPVDVLPPLLQSAATFLPITHALAALRGSILLGQGIGELGPTLLVLALSSGACLVAGLAACVAAIHHGRTDGSLAQY